MLCIAFVTAINEIREGLGLGLDAFRGLRLGSARMTLEPGVELSIRSALIFYCKK